MILEHGSYKYLIDKKITNLLYKDLVEKDEIKHLQISKDIVSFLESIKVNYKKPINIYKYKTEGILDFYRGTYVASGNILQGPDAYKLVEDDSEIDTYEFTGEIIDLHTYFQFYLDEDQENQLVLLEFNLIVENR